MSVRGTAGGASCASAGEPPLWLPWIRGASTPDAGALNLLHGTKVESSRGEALMFRSWTRTFLGNTTSFFALGRSITFKTPSLLSRSFTPCARESSSWKPTLTSWRWIPQSVCFIKSSKPYGDPTCLWGPNALCVESWMRYAGFSDAHMVNFKVKPGKLERRPGCVSRLSIIKITTINSSIVGLLCP